MLHYGDVEDDVDNPPIEALPEKREWISWVTKVKRKRCEAAVFDWFQTHSVPVAEIKGLLTGKDCPHMKDNKGKQNKVGGAPPLSFCSPAPSPS